MEAEILNLSGEAVGKCDLPVQLFGCEVRSDIIHMVVRWQLAKRRLGTRKSQTRDDVSFSTRKIMKQKGSGRARKGSKKSPILRKGAVIFGPVVRSHEFSLNKKVKAIGLKSSISSKFGSGECVIIDKIDDNIKKTRELVSAMEKLGLGNLSVLIVDKNIDANLKMASSNLHKYNVLPVTGMNVYDIVKHDTLILTVDALNILIKRFGYVCEA